jgi:class 3 adenylate cyclase
LVDHFMTAPIKRKIAAIMAADVAGYTRLISEDEEETITRLGSYREVFDFLIARYGGRIFNTAGDAVMTEFSSSVEAVRCAVDIQESLRTRNLSYPPERQMHFRIGISVGDVIERDGDLLGDGVNVAARLEGLAAPGGICVSRSVFEQVSNKASISFSDIGEQKVKNIPNPIHAYMVGNLDGAAKAPLAPVSLLADLPRFRPQTLVAAGLTVAACIAGGTLLWRNAAKPPPVAVAQLPQPAAERTQVVTIPQAGAPAPVASSAPPAVPVAGAIGVVGRLTLLSPPAGSTCHAQVLEMNPRFVETAVDISSSQPVIEIAARDLCGLAVAGSGQVQARFAPGTVAGTIASLSSGARIIFNPSSSGARLPDIALGGSTLEKIELRRQ